MTTTALRPIVTLLLCCALAPLASGAEPAPEPAAGKADSPIAWKKTKLSSKFYGEGAHFGDFNKDGKMDIVSGPYWYPGPDFSEERKHEYYPAKTFDPKGYSDNFFAFTHDFNDDGWTDILIYGFPGKDASWFENPQGKEGHWKRHVVFPMVDNESPTWADLTGDGKPEIVFNTGGTDKEGGQLGYATPDWSDTTRPWTFHPISPKEKRYQRFTHGLGIGDVNGDGKPDILEATGWWEQPSSLEGDPLWKKHEANFGKGGAQMYAYDVNADGRNDVITSLQAHGYGLAWFEQKEDGKFEQHLIMGDKPEQNPQGVKFSQLHAVDLVDVDGDGLKDILTGKRYWAHGPTGDAEPAAPAVVYWFKLTRKGGKAEYVAHKIDDDSGVGTQVVAGDVNGDKKPDVVIGNKKGTYVIVQQPPQVSVGGEGR